MKKIKVYYSAEEEIEVPEEQYYKWYKATRSLDEIAEDCDEDWDECVKECEKVIRKDNKKLQYSIEQVNLILLNGAEYLFYEE